MLHTIENEKLKVSITDVGAELMSIKLKKDGTEYLWQGDAKYWEDRAVVIFPICGRLVDGYYTYGGKKYEMPLHGFVQKAPMRVVSDKPDELAFEISANEETKKMYPFDFTFRATYRLDGNKIAVTYTVKNNGKGDLPYSLGGHPGFNVPMAKGTNFDDYYLEFGEKCNPELFLLSPACFITGETAPYALKDGKYLPLRHNLFDNDALFFKDTAKSVTLKSDKTDKSVKVSFADMEYVGFWHADHTEAPFVCIEPWNGLPGTDGIVDDFATKRAMRHLDAGKTEQFTFTIEIN